MDEIQTLNFADAANRALRQALDADPRVILYGEDVGRPGGVFGVSKGLSKLFGARVFDTPISESAILGSAIGAAQMGLKPIVEIMWSDFTLVALDQLVNQAANVRYVSRGEVTADIVVRMQQGNAPGSCAQHSQCLEAMFLHVPGLRVVMPFTAQDAYDAILTAVDCPDPVLVIENRTLYRGEPQEVHVGGPVRPIGWCRRHRVGNDATLVTWGAMTGRALEAADLLAADGINVDLLETVWLNPFPWDEVLDSVARTKRLVVTHEAVRTGGFGAEVLSRVAESGISLASPPQRVTALDTRIPAAPALARAVLPQAGQIAHAVGTAVRVPHRLAPSSDHVRTND